MMKVYMLVHKQDTSSMWDADADIFLTKEKAQEVMQEQYRAALESWGINDLTEPSEDFHWTCDENQAEISDDCKCEYEQWQIQEKELDVKAAVEVRGGLVQSVIANAGIDVDVYDLDVSDFPDDGEVDEADRKGREFTELSNRPDWGSVW
jgi:hypothetical protein